MKQNFYLSVMTFTLIFILVGCTNNYRDGVSEYEAGNYEKAIEYFHEISEEDEYYDETQIMIAKIDSILEEQRLEQERQDSIAKIVREQRQIYRELQQMQEKAIQQADKRYPNPNDWEKHTDFVDKLDKINEQKLIDSYNISKDSLIQIVVKATEERWWN